MAFFLTREQVYRLLQRLNPEGAYADGAPCAFFTTSEQDSVADVIATGYANAQRIYDNQWPQYAVERIDDHVFKYFGYLFDASTPLQTKRDKVIAKARKQPNISQFEVLKAGVNVLPVGVLAQFAAYNCGQAASWQLGVSILGINTNLAFDHSFAQLNISPADWCDFLANLHWRLGQDALGVDTYLSEYENNEVEEPQLEAFGYEFRIFGYTPSDTELQQLELELNRAEPGRSFHVIRPNLVLSDFGLLTTVTDVDQFSGVDCITIDPGSSTGYSGRTT